MISPLAFRRFYTVTQTISRQFTMSSLPSVLNTQIIAADPSSLVTKHTPDLEELHVSFSPSAKETIQSLETAVDALIHTSVPVAFPTETVYGLGADATRSSAVRGIYAAKNRPIDNPLIVHISSLSQLRTLLGPSEPGSDSIPAIYKPLIQRFWPGPLTILLPTSSDSPRQLAPEVTAGLKTFGARMPSSPLALALIKQSDLPLAAPSANASTRPSPTRAEHVLYDLRGRIQYILDGGSCMVGVESTVVDGLSDPPAILRPGGVSLDEIRQIKGWESCIKGYKDYDESGSETKTRGMANGSSGPETIDHAPRAPGMKYKHYSPTAKVALVKAGLASSDDLKQLINTAVEHGRYSKIGVLRAKKWQSPVAASNGVESKKIPNGHVEPEINGNTDASNDYQQAELLTFTQHLVQSTTTNTSYTVHDAQLGRSAREMARNLFHALRELDLLGADLIFVEGLDDSVESTNGKAEDGSDDEAAAAVMNRLRKAAEIKINTLPWEPERIGASGA